MSKEIWVYAEQNGGEPVSVVYELLAKANQIAVQIGERKVAAVVLGNGNQSAVEALKAAGAEIVYTVEHTELAQYRCDVYALAMKQVIETYQPEYLFFGATGVGSELAPTVAASVKTGLAAHCVDLRYDGDRLNCMVPAFGGKVVSEIYIPNARPVMASVRPGILEAGPVKVTDAEVVTVDTSFLNGVASGEEFLGFDPVEKEANDIANAEVVIAAGRGAASDTAWSAVNQLTDRLNGAFAWSRSLIDTGRVKDESCMIGTSGKSVKPQLLINVGVSGATQYVCGINKSKTVISINRDKKAKIFEHSDYGVVGDAEKILPAVLAKLQA